MWYTLTNIGEPEHPRTIMNGAYSTIFDTNIPGAHHVLCALNLNTLGSYCMTITYSSLEYSNIFCLSRSVLVYLAPYIFNLYSLLTPLLETSYCFLHCCIG